jgi:hypothetical protein
MLLFMGALSLAACNRETDKKEDTDTTTVAESQVQAGEADYEAEYRNRASRMGTRMASDLKFDTATQSQVESVYYNRSRRLAELQNRYHLQGNNQSGGQAAGADTTGMYQEMHNIDLDTDKELGTILSPEQFKIYQTNRSSYYDGETSTGDATPRDVQVEGEEIKVKTGDIKVKAEPGKSKVETSTYESKIDGDETKFKSKDTKIKTEPGKTKYESGDTKIKIKEKD